MARSPSSPERVLIVNDQGAPTGGAELLTLSLRDGLRARGIDARILASTAGSTPRSFAADYACRGSTSPLRNGLRLVNPWARRALVRVLEEFRPDVVHLRMFLTQLSPAILPPLGGVPTVYHASWYSTVCPNGLKLLPDGSLCRYRAGVACLHHGCFHAPGWALVMGQRRLLRRGWPAIDRVVANSHAVRAELVSHGIEPVEVIWNGVVDRGERPPLGGPPTAAYAGRLSREKGVDVLVRAFAAAAATLPDARLVVAGDGPDREALTRLAAGLGVGDRVTFLGHVDREALEGRLAPAWVHVVPSRLAEPFGLAAAEAMMRGTAVVASDAGGLAEVVVDGETGWRVPPGDVDALSGALRRALGDRSAAEAAGAAARRRAKDEFSHDVFLTRFTDLYRDLLQESHP